MKKKAYVHFNRYTEEFEVGENNVKDITPIHLESSFLLVVFTDGTEKRFFNAPFEYEESGGDPLPEDAPY